MENKDISLVAESSSGFTFSTREPLVYQGDLIISTGTAEDHWFAARKGDKWRYDTFHGTQPWISQLRSDKLYFIDNQKKTFWEMPDGGTSGSHPGYFNGLTRNFFTGVEHREFDEIGREGSIVKYKIRGDDPSNGEILVYVDTVSGMMVKQEFTDKKGMGDSLSPLSYIYEIKNLKLDVDDSVFDIPKGYKKVPFVDNPAMPHLN